ncbi:hypothetical protein QWZ10_23275 [Paracoccus cavernae]|uniref:Uncharacterized protein n=1 Tax=Paracoccus cavernae TaxID=1571207 RepID=A0ABT8DC95_9RHOB|nr:hypothetical protein [Paracoccus cavernae]
MRLSPRPIASWATRFIITPHSPRHAPSRRWRKMVSRSMMRPSFQAISVAQGTKTATSPRLSNPEP